MASVNIEFTSNNITYSNGDSLIVSFDGPFVGIDAFTGYSEITTPDQTDNDYLITNIRWSKDFQTWSPWILVSRNPDGTKNFPAIDFEQSANVY